MDEHRAREIYAQHFAGRQAPFTGSYKLVHSYQLEAAGMRLDVGLGGSVEDCRREFPPQLTLPQQLDDLAEDSMLVEIRQGDDRWEHFNEPW
jgi:hypothetical protein